MNKLKSHQPVARVITALLLMVSFVQVQGLAAAVSAPIALSAQPADSVQQAACASPLIDDFSSGPYRVTLPATGQEDNTQSGTMLGGSRFTRFAVPDDPNNNPHELPSTLVIDPSKAPSLVVASAYKTFHGLQVFYGFEAPLDANLTCYDQFRVHFAASDLGLNFNMQFVTANNPSPWQCGQNIPGQTTGTGFVADFPFNCFVNNDPNARPDFQHINQIRLLIGSGSAIAANDYAIKKVDMVRGGCGLPICLPLP